MLGLTWAYRAIGRLAEKRPAGAPALLGAAAGILAVTTVISLIGGLLIAAQMADTRFLVKVLSFTGAKASIVMPMLLLAALVLTDGAANAGESLAEYWARIAHRVRGLLAQPIYIWALLLGAVAMAITAVVVMRSGNDTGVGASSLELHFRGLLDNAFLARPRTKEFLFGHPLFIIAMITAARGERGWASLLLLGAAIGQASILNTFCHAHTPVLLSLLRTANGLWLGALFGIAAVVIFGWKAITARQPVSG